MDAALLDDYVDHPLINAMAAAGGPPRLILLPHSLWKSVLSKTVKVFTRSIPLDICSSCATEVLLFILLLMRQSPFVSGSWMSTCFISVNVRKPGAVHKHSSTSSKVGVLDTLHA